MVPQQHQTASKSANRRVEDAPAPRRHGPTASGHQHRTAPDSTRHFTALESSWQLTAPAHGTKQRPSSGQRGAARPAHNNTKRVCETHAAHDTRPRHLQISRRKSRLTAVIASEGQGTNHGLAIAPTASSLNSTPSRRRPFTPAAGSNAVHSHFSGTFLKRPAFPLRPSNQEGAPLLQLPANTVPRNM